ncbi:MAG: hypothetical protein MUC93_01375 [Bacteroidales bacterium]|nr:hypothetical protein [Bacteroidales bacterium]
MKSGACVLIALMSLSIISVSAQNPNRERLDSYRIAFFTQKLKLTPYEAEKFWPLFNDLQDRKIKIQLGKMQLNRKINQEAATLSDKEMTEMGDKLIELEVMEAELSRTFHKNFKEVLPPEKVLRLYQAETQYKLLLLNELKDRRQEKGSNFRR